MKEIWIESLAAEYEQEEETIAKMKQIVKDCNRRMEEIKKLQPEAHFENGGIRIWE